MVHGLFMLLVR